MLELAVMVRAEPLPMVMPDRATVCALAFSAMERLPIADKAGAV